MGFNIWELLGFFACIIVIGIMIIPTKIKTEPESKESKRLRMIFGIMQKGEVVERTDTYIKFYCKRYMDCQFYAQLLQDMGISSIVKDQYITVCIGEVK